MKRSGRPIASPCCIRRLLAFDTPAALRARLTTGRVIVRTSGEARRWLETIRPLTQSAEADGPFLIVTVSQVEAETAALVAALVAGGAAVLEVRPEVPALEDVYLDLIGEGR